jgi:hypothetical protein
VPQLIVLIRPVAQDRAEVDRSVAQHDGKHPFHKVGLVELAAGVEKGAEHFRDLTLLFWHEQPQLSGKVKVRLLGTSNTMRVIELRQSR